MDGTEALEEVKEVGNELNILELKVQSGYYVRAGVLRKLRNRLFHAYRDLRANLEVEKGESTHSRPTEDSTD